MKNAYREWISARMNDTRVRLTVLQEDMASRLKIPRSTYASYEEGRAIPSIFTLKRFCDICQTTLDEFMQGSPEYISF